jgi:peptidoglycan/LPS O-acetylase OafA/YrhL
MREHAPPKTFFTYLDAMRGIAALLVMARHVGFFPGLGFAESYLAVDLFFLLSGVVIANAYETRLQTGAMSAMRFMRLRIVRIFPLYLLGSALTLGAWLAGDADTPQALPWLVVLACLMLPSLATPQPFPLNHPAWSLFFELLANLVYALGLGRLGTRGLLAAVALAALAVTALLVAGSTHNLDVGWSQANFAAGLVRVGFSFFAGVLLFRLHRGRRARAPALGGRTGAKPAHGWLYVALVTALLTAHPSGVWQPWFDGVAVLAVLPWLVYRALWCEPGARAARLARWLGAVSYPLYALHAPLSEWVHQALAYCDDAPSRAALGWIGLAFVAVLLPLCAWLNRYFDAPARRLLLARALR